MPMQPRKARGKDVTRIEALLQEGAGKGLLLPRPRSQLFTVLRDFFVLEDPADGRVAGCCALAVIWENMAEVRSLFVAEEYRRRGLGQVLVNACLEEAKSLGISRVFTLTYQVKFFAAAGFVAIPKETLPQKIWTDCIHCPKFPNCDETAMIRDV